MSVARGEDGPLVVAFVRDVSRRAAEEAELIEARDRAVAGEQAKTRMIAVMSHEMRTPLNGILGLLDLLSLTELDDRQRQYVAAMEHSGRMLLGHVNDVLDTSRRAAVSWFWPGTRSTCAAWSIRRSWVCRRRHRRRATN